MLSQAQTLTNQNIPLESWLTQKCKNANIISSASLSLPKNHAGKFYTIEFLSEEQRFIIFHVLERLN